MKFDMNKLMANYGQATIMLHEGSKGCAARAASACGMELSAEEIQAAKSMTDRALSQMAAQKMAETSSELVKTMFSVQARCGECKPLRSLGRMCEGCTEATYALMKVTVNTMLLAVISEYALEDGIAGAERGADMARAEGKLN